MDTKHTLQGKLGYIQQTLKAPKNQKNNFGNYSYRSCEDILEAVKPLLAKCECTLIIDDEVVNIGDRYYVKATARLNYEGFSILAIAYAREPEERKGMDSAQVTGATSSYARKYALNGLFAIDDTKDADTMDNEVKATKVLVSDNTYPGEKEEKFYLAKNESPEEPPLPTEEDPNVRVCSAHEAPAKMIQGQSKTKVDAQGNPKTFWYHKFNDKICFGNGFQ